MRTYCRFIILIGAAITVIACSSNSGKENTTLPQSTQEKSELAALMRVMETHGDLVRIALNTNQPLPERPEGIEALLKASATPNMHIEEKTFPVFVSEYLQSVDRLHSVAQEDRKDAYNGLVQSCSNCHTVNCPGPLMKIDKMFLQSGL